MTEQIIDRRRGMQFGVLVGLYTALLGFVFFPLLFAQELARDPDYVSDLFVVRFGLSLTIAFGAFVTAVQYGRYHQHTFRTHIRSLAWGTFLPYTIAMILLILFGGFEGNFFYFLILTPFAFGSVAFWGWCLTWLTAKWPKAIGLSFAGLLFGSLFGGLVQWLEFWYSVQYIIPFVTLTGVTSAVVGLLLGWWAEKKMATLPVWQVYGITLGTYLLIIPATLYAGVIVNIGFFRWLELDSYFASMLRNDILNIWRINWLPFLALLLTVATLFYMLTREPKEKTQTDVDNAKTVLGILGAFAAIFAILGAISRTSNNVATTQRTPPAYKPPVKPRSQPRTTAPPPAKAKPVANKKPANQPTPQQKQNAQWQETVRKQQEQQRLAQEQWEREQRQYERRRDLTDVEKAQAQEWIDRNN